MTTKALEEVLQRIATWPRQDQEELAAYAREIEARRTGVYRLRDEERAAIHKARQSELVPDNEVEAFWKRRGIE